MAKKNYSVELNQVLLQCMMEPDPMLAMLEWLCVQLMEAEVSNKVGAEKNEHEPGRTSYRSGYRPRRFDTRMGTIYLLVPKIRNGGYVPFFVTERKRSEVALIQVVQEAYAQGVSTRRMEKLAQSLGIESLSKSQASEMAKGLDDQVRAFRERPLSDTQYPVIWVDALYEKVRYDGRVISMAVMVACGVDEEGKRHVLAVETMLEESKAAYEQFFTGLKERGLTSPKLIISDAHSGLVAAIRSSFPGTSWQRCKVHFMRNILAHVSHKEKSAFAAKLKLIWTAPTRKDALALAQNLIEEYEKRFPKAVQILEDGLEDSIQFYAFEALDARKISSTNMLERLNREIRRRTRVVGIFPNPESYLRLATTYLIEYTEDWSVSRAYLSADSISATLNPPA